MDFFYHVISETFYNLSVFLIEVFFLSLAQISTIFKYLRSKNKRKENNPLKNITVKKP